ncbi:hypothetical protein GCM10018781_09570 [Kitasatospora indigofera]|uniref:Uncharacterized protein n=1 Tax=Kitasatospora indigofera TaxID=67307 RepID=A0A919KL24_9ACTN|nr:hypothetical protein GCM10018781_09570 [Kitasatospora indigofera]
MPAPVGVLRTRHTARVRGRAHRRAPGPGPGRSAPDRPDGSAPDESAPDESAPDDRGSSGALPAVQGRGGAGVLGAGEPAS